MNSQGNTTPQVTTLLMKVESKGERGREKGGGSGMYQSIKERRVCDAMKMNEKLRERVCLTVGCFGSSSSSPSSWNENFS